HRDGVGTAHLETLHEILAVGARAHRRREPGAAIGDLYRRLTDGLALLIRHLPRDRPRSHALGSCDARAEHCKERRGHEGAARANDPAHGWTSPWKESRPGESVPDPKPRQGR